MSTKGSGYLASPKLETSTANQEIIDSAPAHWTQGYKLYKFSFMNRQDVTVIINKKTTAYLEARQGFNMEQGDEPIFSFVIVDANVTFNFIGAF